MSPFNIKNFFDGRQSALGLFANLCRDRSLSEENPVILYEEAIRRFDLGQESIKSVAYLLVTVVKAGHLLSLGGHKSGSCITLYTSAL